MQYESTGSDSERAARNFEKRGFLGLRGKQWQK